VFKNNLVNAVPDLLARVLNHHLAGLDLALAVEAATVNAGTEHAHRLFGVGGKVAEPVWKEGRKEGRKEIDRLTMVPHLMSECSCEKA
jgi:hypothetical protein